MADFTFAAPVDSSIGTITITQSMTAVSPGNGGTLTISSGTNVPSKGYALIDSELIQYASISATTLTLASAGARGAGNPATTAAAHSSGTAIYFDVIPSQQVRELRDKFDATTGHAHTGAAGDAPAVTDANLSTSDITTNDASTLKHGFLKKLDNVATNFMNGQGSWAAPTSAGVPSSAFLGWSSTVASIPAGYTEMTAMRGRVWVGVPLGGTVAGTVGTALADLASPSHSHSGPSHTHTSAAHGHSIPSHSHSIGAASSGWQANSDPNTAHQSTTSVASLSADTGTPGPTGADGTGNTGATAAHLPYAQYAYMLKS